MSVEFVKGTITNIKHGYFTRHGGVSTGQNDSLNVAKHVDDEEELVDKNRLLALEAMHVEPDYFAFLGRLEHSNRIEEVTKAAGGMEFVDHDALITNTPGLAIGLSVADCMAIIVVDEQCPALGLIHAGWRGLEVEVIRHTIDALKQEFEADQSRMKAIIGPSIGPESYLVNSDVAEVFDSKYSTTHGEQYLLDLWAIAEDQLRASGVEKIENLKIDTFKDDRFYSHRRSGGETGRFLAIASL